MENGECVDDVKPGVCGNKPGLPIPEPETECKAGEKLFKGKCVKVCPKGTFAKDGGCLPCSRKCGSCIGNKYHCTSCKPGRVVVF